MTPTPTPSAPQEVPQWAIQAAFEIGFVYSGSNLIAGANAEHFAAIIHRHAQPALTAATEEIAKLKAERDQWRMSSVCRELQAQLAAHREWGGKAREAIRDTTDFLDSTGEKTSVPLLFSDLCKCIASFPTDSTRPKDGPGDTEINDYMKAILCIGHWDLHHHNLLSACRSVIVSRRAFSTAQSAVLAETLDKLEEVMALKTPDWPKSAAMQSQEKAP